MGRGAQGFRGDGYAVLCLECDRSYTSVSICPNSLTVCIQWVHVVVCDLCFKKNDSEIRVAYIQKEYSGRNIFVSVLKGQWHIMYI